MTVISTGVRVLNTMRPRPWCRHQMESFSALLALFRGMTGGFPSQRLVTWSFDVFFDLRQNKRLRKQLKPWWFETPPRPLLRHCNAKWPRFRRRHFQMHFREWKVQMLFSDWSLDHSTGIVIMGMLWGNNDGKPSLVLEMAWCHQATSHCMDQCWQRPMTPYGVTRPQLVNWFWCTNAYTIENSISFSDSLSTIAAKITTKANGANGNYSDVIMSAMAFQITGVSIVYSTVWSCTENIKAPRHWSVWGEFTCDRWIPRTMCQ